MTATANLKNDVMHEYAKQEPARAPMFPLVSDDEKKRRKEAAKEAEASLRLEGLASSPAMKAISAEWERGEITSEEMTERVKALYIRRG
jgi:hypothetical protein